jgi:hypothetical protein
LVGLLRKLHIGTVAMQALGKNGGILEGRKRKKFTQRREGKARKGREEEGKE